MVNIKGRFDEFGIPTLWAASDIPLAEHEEDYPRLESIVRRKLTPTEVSAADSMGSEHASYGSSRFYLKTLLPVNGPNHISGIGDEAATVVLWVNPETGKSVTGSYSSESHNGPSYVCAHPGAATGTGGQERDDCVESGKKSDAIYESRRQCHPIHNPANDPVKQHTDETTKGIADYGNAMGIPHGDGAIKFHTNFTGNNLVNVMGISIQDRDKLCTNKVPTTDDPSKFVGIYIGKASDTTGFGGVKFASVAIDMDNQDLNEKAVQDPDPHLQEADMRGIELLNETAYKEGWKDMFSIKDMGGAGLLCSTVEQLHDDIGVIINGDLVPQNEPRTSSELLEAETQERFFVYVHENYAQKVLDIFNKDIGLPHINQGACAKVIGRCNNTGRYIFVNNGVVDVDVPADDLKAGPLEFRAVKEPVRKTHEMPDDSSISLDKKIDAILSSINFKSDSYVHDHYDKHVRSTNIVNRGQGCASLRTHDKFEGEAGYSISFDSNCVYGLIDPKKQAEDSFVRGAWKMAAVGCSVVGVTNNANYGRTTIPEEMWEFKEGQSGVSKACYNWELEAEYLDMISHDQEITEKLENDQRRHLTVNSGNCSLNKANANTGTAIPPTAILGLVGWTNQPENYATWDLKPEDSSMFLIGARQSALGGSDYLQSLHGPECIGDMLFDIDYETSQGEVNAIIRAVRLGMVSAANHIEEGGLYNAVAEMVANTQQDVNVSINTSEIGDSDFTIEQKISSESYGMVMQISNDKRQEFKEMMEQQGITIYEIGSCQTAKEGEGNLNIRGEESILHTASQDHIKEKYHPKLERMLNGVAA